MALHHAEERGDVGRTAGGRLQDIADFAEVFLLLRTVLEWDAPEYADWLSRTLVDQLVKE